MRRIQNIFEFFSSKRFKFSVVILGLAMFILVLMPSAYFTVSEQENAVVLTAGKVTDVKEAGLHFKMPFIQSVRKVNMTTQGMSMGYNEAPNVADNQEISTQNVIQDDSVMITNDFNLVSVDFYIEWRVTSPVKALFSVYDYEVLLQNIIQSSARDVISNYGVDSVLTDGKSEIQGKIKELINKVLDTYDIGILVTNVIIQDAEPPNQEVNAAFKAVEDAKQKKDTMLNEANKYYNENIPNARAEADKIIKNAEGIKEARINEANGQAARFNELFSGFIANPEITKTRMYYETMEQILPDLKVYIEGNDSSVLKMLNIGNNQGANNE